MTPSSLLRLRSTRLAQDAQVMPAIGSSTCSVIVVVLMPVSSGVRGRWSALGCVLGECRGVDAAAGAELDEQAVRAGLVQLGVEGDRSVLDALGDRMDVRVGAVGGAQRDEVSVGAEIGLKVLDRLAGAGDAERQLR